MDLYITDSKYIMEKLILLLNCKYKSENLYCSNLNTLICIKPIYEFNTNGGKGRWVFKLKDFDKELVFNVEYLSRTDIKNIKEVISTVAQDQLNIINFCEPTIQGQLNFDIFIKQINIDTDHIKRIWLRENKINSTTLKKTESNNEFKALSDALLAERLIDIIWVYKSQELFGQYTPIKLKEMIVLVILQDRENQIEKKEEELMGGRDYFRLELKCQGIKFKWYNNKTKSDRVYKIEEAEDIAKYLNEKNILITNVVYNIKSKPHPLLYNTTDLVNEAQKLKVGEINKITEALANLFKKGHISNPNTESRHLPNEFINRSYLILSALKTMNKYRIYIKYIKGKSKIEITDRIINNNLVDKNHAIVPTETMPALGELNEIEKEIYNLIVKRFLSAFMGETIIKTITIHGYIDETNQAKYEDSQVMEYGWNLLYMDDESEYLVGELIDKPQEKEVNIDEIIVKSGKKYQITNTTIPVRNLKSKLRYTPSHVLQLLDSCGNLVKNENKKVRRRHLGIGIVEERSAIVEEMIRGNLVVLCEEDNRLSVSEKGQNILSVVPEQLASINYLKGLIKKIKAIQPGIETIRSVVNEHLLTINRLLLERELRIQQENIKIDYSDITEKKICCYCYNKFKEEQDNIVCSVCGFHIPKVKSGYILSVKDIEDIINYGITDLITGFKFKGGTITNGKAKLYRTEKKVIAFDFEKRTKDRQL